MPEEQKIFKIFLQFNIVWPFHLHLNFIQYSTRFNRQFIHKTKEIAFALLSSLNFTSNSFFSKLYSRTKLSWLWDNSWYFALNFAALISSSWLWKVVLVPASFLVLKLDFCKGYVLYDVETNRRPLPYESFCFLWLLCYYWIPWSHPVEFRRLCQDGCSDETKRQLLLSKWETQQSQRKTHWQCSQ